MKESSREIGRVGAVLLVTILAFVVRALYLRDVEANVVLDVPQGEGMLFERWARGAFRAADVPVRAPLFGWIVSVAWESAQTHTLLRWIQVGVSTLTVALVADTARRWQGTLAAVVAGGLLALAWPSILLVGDPVPATFATFLVALCLWSLLRAGWDGSVLTAVTSSLAAGLASITIPWLIGLVGPVAMAPRWIWPSSGPRVWSPRWSAILLLVGLLPSITLTAVHGIQSGTWAVSREVVDQWSLNRSADGGGPDAVLRPATPPGTKPLVVAGADAAEPGFPFRHVFSRLVDGWGGAESGPGLNFHFLRDQSRLLSLPMFFSWWWLLSGAVLGVVAAVDRRSLRAPVWFFLAGSLLMLGSVVHSGQRLPLTVPLAVLCGVGAAATIRRTGTRPLGAVGAAVLVAALTGTHYFADADRDLDRDAKSMALRASVRLRTGDPNGARDDLVAGIRILRPHPDAALEDQLRRDLTRVYSRLRLVDELKLELDGLSARYPDDPSLVALWGDYHRMIRKLVQARQNYTRAKELDRTTADARIGLGWVYIEDNRAYHSQGEFRAARAIDPRDARAVTGLAWLAYRENNDETRAMRMVKQAIQMDRTYGPAHHLIGDLYRANDQLAEGVWHLREAVRLDPYNMKARVWLNRSGAGVEHPPGAEDDMP